MADTSLPPTGISGVGKEEPPPFSLWVQVSNAAIAVVSFTSPWIVAGYNFSPVGFSYYFAWGVAAFLISMQVVRIRRLWMKSKGIEVESSWRKFALAEMLILLTGFAVLVGLSSKQWRTYQQYAAIKNQVNEIVGPGGSVYFLLDGDSSIWVRDPTFDDKRLVALASHLAQYFPERQLKKLSLACRRKRLNRNTPLSETSGITDKSVPLILKWKQLEYLYLGGTAITPAGLDEISALPDLDEKSRMFIQNCRDRRIRHAETQRAASGI